MDIDIEIFKKTIVEYFSHLRSLETQIAAYRFAIHLATESGLADRSIPWEKMVEAAKDSSAIQELMAKKYNPLVQELLLSFDLADMQAKILELMRQWNPSGPPQ